jgi:hypothetical protein
MIGAWKQKRHEGGLRPKVKVIGNSVSAAHVDQAVGWSLIASSIGTTDHAFTIGLMNQISNAVRSDTGADEDGINFVLAVVQELQPRDQIEAMLAAQMAMVQRQAMTTIGSMKRADMLNQFEAYERATTKLMRTFTTQMEALKRYRATGQTVTVEHVHVHAGGQAVVGNITRGGGAKLNSEATP